MSAYKTLATACGVASLALLLPILISSSDSTNDILAAMMGEGHVRNEDGSAKHPLLFREMLRNNATLLERLGQDHPDWPEIIKGDSLDAFQDMLRTERAESNEKRAALERAYEEKREKIAKKIRKCLKKGGSEEACMKIEQQEMAKGMPAIRRMRMMGPHSTEDDQYNQQSPEVPAHMRCDACQAVTYQAAHSVAAALGARKRDDKVSILTIETLEVTCHNASLWTTEYGYSPGQTGVNMLAGPGIGDGHQHWEENNGDTVVPQTLHSDGIGRRLRDACLAVLLGTAPDEEEIATVVLEEMAKGGDGPKGAAAALRVLACEQPGQPCAA